MLSPTLFEALGDASVLAAVATAAGLGFRSLASVLGVWIKEASRTRRLNRALEDAKPGQRARIIVACSQLEGKYATISDDDRTAAPAPADARVEPQLPPANRE